MKQQQQQQQQWSERRVVEAGGGLGIFLSAPEGVDEGGGGDGADALPEPESWGDSAGGGEWEVHGWEQ